MYFCQNDYIENEKDNIILVLYNNADARRMQRQ